jgi:hypothetical protein
LLIKTAVATAQIHINRGAPEYTMAKDAMVVILPMYPSAKSICG